MPNNSKSKATFKATKEGSSLCRYCGEDIKRHEGPLGRCRHPRILKFERASVELENVRDEIESDREAIKSAKSLIKFLKRSLKRSQTKEARIKSKVEELRGPAERAANGRKSLLVDDDNEIRGRRMYSPCGIQEGPPAAACEPPRKMTFEELWKINEEMPPESFVFDGVKHISAMQRDRMQTIFRDKIRSGYYGSRKYRVVMLPLIEAEEKNMMENFGGDVKRFEEWIYNQSQHRENVLDNLSGLIDVVRDGVKVLVNESDIDNLLLRQHIKSTHVFQTSAQREYLQNMFRKGCIEGVFVPGEYEDVIRKWLEAEGIPTMEKTKRSQMPPPGYKPRI